jgi:hypothetical protein
VGRHLRGAPRLYRGSAPTTQDARTPWILHGRRDFPRDGWSRPLDEPVAHPPLAVTKPWTELRVNPPSGPGLTNRQGDARLRRGEPVSAG